MLDKLDQPTIPEGYGVSIAFYSLLEMVSSVRFLILGEMTDDQNQGQIVHKYQRQNQDQRPISQSESKKGQSQEGEGDGGKNEDSALHEELINSSWCGMLAALSLLLDARYDVSSFFELSSLSLILTVM